MSNNIQTISYEYEKCHFEGICSINPKLSPVQEIILLYLKELSFYLLKLKEFGVTNKLIKESVVYALSSIVTNAEYNQENFYEIIIKLDNYIEQSKFLYEKLCTKNNLQAQYLKPYFKRTKVFNLTDSIRKSEKYLLQKNRRLKIKEKNLLNIMLILVKSIFIKMSEITKLNKNDNNPYYAILSMLNEMNSIKFSKENAQKEIKKFIHIYHKLGKDIFETKIELYGKIIKTEVSISPTIGKAILISGSDFKILEDVLNATKGTDIGVYTHGIEMLMAHAFPKLCSHPNLKGHFGTGMDTSLVDFASFPGAIVMTRSSIQRLEYLYRGRLFTLDPIAPPGVIKIENNNFDPLIKSALEAKGFSKEQKKPPIKVGFSLKELNKQIDKIVDKIIKNNIKNLYIIGLLNYSNIYTKYFDKFFELLPKDCYAISLSYDKIGENIFHINSFHSYLLVYKILEALNSKLPLNEMNICTFLTKCDKYTIANLIYLKEIGIKNVYMCKCPPELVNPALIETLKETFGVKEFNDPKKDLAETLLQ